MSTNKLPKGALKEIPISEIKNLLAHTHQVDITSDTIREKIHNTIENSHNKRIYDKDILSMKDFENIITSMSRKGIDFKKPIDKNNKEKDRKEYFEKHWENFATQKTEQEIKDIFYIFGIHSKKDFINFAHSKPFEKIDYYYPEHSTSKGSLGLLREFIHSNEDREKFLKELKKNDLFVHLIPRLRDGAEILSKMQRNIDELIFFVGSDENTESLLNYCSRITSKNLQLFFEKIPLFTEDGTIDRNHHFFTIPEAKYFWQMDTENIFHLFSLYDIQTSEQILKMYELYGKNQPNNFLNSQNPVFLKRLDNIQKSGKVDALKIQKFLEKYIFFNATHTNFTQSINTFLLHPQSEDILAYFINNKQKSFPDFLKKIHEIEFMGNYFTKEYYYWNNNSQKDHEMFNFHINDFPFILDGNTDEIIKKEEKYMQNEHFTEEEKRIWNNAVRTKNHETIKKISIERQIKRFFENFEKKLINIIYQDFPEITTKNPEKILRPEFIDAYKMSVNPRYNKKQFHEILKKYLEGEFDDISQMNQFKTPKNQKWLSENLNEEQQKIWLSKNRKEYNFEKNESKENSFEKERQHHIRVINDKIREIGRLGLVFEEFTGEGGAHLEEHIKGILYYEEAFIRFHGGKHLFDDIRFQLESIKKIDEQEKIYKQNSIENRILTKHKKIIIEREQDPLRVMMMGNWVQGSCLAFESSTGNYYSTAANAIDANKAVFYLYNEKNELLGRVLTTIGQDQKLTRYKMYYAKFPEHGLDKIFDDYIKTLAEKMDIDINGGQYEVQNIESEEWYKDGEQRIFR